MVKQKTIRLLVTVGLVIAILIMTLSACGNRYSIEFSVKENAFSFGVNGANFPTIRDLIQSENELQEIIYENNIILDIENYNEEFFVDSALILLVFFHSSSRNAGINDIRVRDNVLEIHRTHHSADHDGLFQHFIIIEIRQADIVGVTDMQAVIRERRAR